MNTHSQDIKAAIDRVKAVQNGDSPASVYGADCQRKMKDDCCKVGNWFVARLNGKTIPIVSIDQNLGAVGMLEVSPETAELYAAVLQRDGVLKFGGLIASDKLSGDRVLEVFLMID